MEEQEPAYPFSFDGSACQNCPGRCCTGASGNIWASLDELEAMAEHTGLSLSGFIRRYTRRVGRRFSLIEKPWGNGEHACVFYDEQCTIYQVRPTQCRTFPYWPRYGRGNLEELLDECPGVTQTTRQDG